MERKAHGVEPVALGGDFKLIDQAKDTVELRTESRSSRAVRMEAWVEKFLWILMCYESDSTIEKILSDPGLAHECGVLMRMYADRKISDGFNAERKARGRGCRRTVERAQRGLAEAAKIFQFQQRADLAIAANHLSAELTVFDRLAVEAFNTKRHGRDRDHGLLDYCQRILESRLGLRVPYSSLATLVTAAERAQAEAVGLEPPAPVDEDTVRKRLGHLRDNAPQWTKALLEQKPPTKPA